VPQHKEKVATVLALLVRYIHRSSYRIGYAVMGRNLIIYSSLSLHVTLYLSLHIIFGLHLRLALKFSTVIITSCILQYVCNSFNDLNVIMFTDH
jgi:hypothetical protein